MAIIIKQPLTLSDVSGIGLTQIRSLPIGKHYDNITFYHIDGKTYMRTGAVTAAPSTGLLNDGTDQTTTMNTIVFSSDVKSLVFDNGNFTVNGIVDCQGKILTFRNQSAIVGSGTLKNFILDADYRQWCFGVNLTVQPIGSVRDMISVINFGAKPDGVTDSTAYIQKACDTVVYNPLLPRDLCIPKGNYLCNDGISVENWNGTNYGFYSIRIIGEKVAGFTSLAYNTQMYFPNKNSFAFNFQRARTSSIEGILIQGPFSPSFADYKTFSETKFANYLGASGVRESKYSPCVGGSVDAFTNGNLPPDGGYPGKTAKYRGLGISDTGGSSNVFFKQCRIYGFAAAIGLSVNGTTQNAEDIVISECCLGDAKVGIAVCQAQNKDCYINNLICWDRVHTVIDNNTFGAGSGSVPYIAGACFAGFVNRLFNVISAPQSFSASGIFGESLFTMGTVSTLLGCTINAPTFDFATSIYPGTGSPDFYFSGSNVHFIGGTFRINDNSVKRLHVSTLNCEFNGVTFNDLPLLEPASVNYNRANFINCSVQGGGVIGIENTRVVGTGVTENTILFGNFTQDYSNGGVWIDLKKKYSETRPEMNELQLGSFAIAVDNPTKTATLNISGVQAAVQLGDYLRSYTSVTGYEGGTITYPVLGRVSAINYSTGDVTLSEVPLYLINGTYSVVLSYVRRIGRPFIGDIISGNDTINNVEAFDSYPAVGDRIESAFFGLAASGLGTGKFGAYIKAVNAGAKTVQLSFPSTVTRAGVDFSLGTPEVIVKSIYRPSDSAVNSIARVFPKGTKWTVKDSNQVVSNINEEWNFIRGGYLSAATVSGNHQAVFYNPPPIRNNAGVIEYYNEGTDTWIAV